jgi:hypothetical protein
MSEVKVNKISPRSGTTVTLGDSGDTIAITSGASLTGFTSTGIDDNATSTAITIDSNEKVLVGMTVSSGDSDGIQLIQDGRIFSTVDGQLSAILNRKSSDGGIVEFRKDGTPVGSIDVSSSGISIKLGGTGSANDLDDYEEGTWTPALSGATTTTYNVQTGVYTKVGRIVTAHFELHINAKGNGNKALISGLPFSCQNQNGQSGCLGLYSGLAKSPNYLTMRMDNGSSSLDFAGTDSETSGLSFAYTIFDVDGARVIGSIQYTTS